VKIEHLVGIHSRYSHASADHLVAGLRASGVLRDHEVVDLNAPVCDFLSAIDPLVSSTESLLGVLERCSGWSGALADRIVGGEVSRLLVSMRQAMLLDDPTVLTDTALEAIRATSSPVVVLGLGGKDDADFIRAHDGVVWSVDHAVPTGIPINHPLPLACVDEFVAADLVSAPIGI
jgi:hypothetical protein